MFRQHICGRDVRLCRCCAQVCAYVQVTDQRISQPDVHWALVEAHCRLFSLNSQGKKVFKARYITLTARPTELTCQFVSPDCQATSCPQQYTHANSPLLKNEHLLKVGFHFAAFNMPCCNLYNVCEERTKCT